MRANVPDTPGVARELFGPALPTVERYASLLAQQGVEWGLMGPREVSRLWDRHLLNCGVLTELVPYGASVADLGSGAGLPGIVMALMRDDLDVLLIEPLARRTRFLSLCVERLELSPRVRVVRGRAEGLQEQVSVDVVISRAVAPLDRLAKWSVPLVRPGGTVLAIKGESAVDEVRRASGELRRLGGRSVEVLRVGSEFLAVPTTVVRFLSAGSSESRG